MKCPVDDSPLTMSERSGIEIDYCPTCRGVWLDRGELDKIIERSLTQPGPAPAPPPSAPAPQQQYGRPQYDPGYQQRGHSSGHHRPKRKESWLSELFD